MAGNSSLALSTTREYLMMAVSISYFLSENQSPHSGSDPHGPPSSTYKGLRAPFAFAHREASCPFSVDGIDAHAAWYVTVQ